MDSQPDHKTTVCSLAADLGHNTISRSRLRAGRRPDHEAMTWSYRPAGTHRAGSWCNVETAGRAADQTVLALRGVAPAWPASLVMTP
jgi:hypothetical protein